MTKIKTSKTKVAELGKRKPGRPPATQTNSISRDAILQTAYELAKTVPLQDLSIVLVAKVMGVTPALIHYYIDGRDWLTSGVMNRFYHDILEDWPEPTGRWEVDAFEAAKTIYEHLVTYAGIASYTVLRNRFRIFQLTESDETDFGVEMLERFVSRVMQAGISPERTGIYSHIWMEFIISSAHGTVSHRYPSDYKDFLESKNKTLDPKRYPSIHAIQPLKLDGMAAFREGCRLIMLGIQSEQFRRAVEGVEPGLGLQAAPPTPTPAKRKKPALNS